MKQIFSLLVGLIFSLSSMAGFSVRGGGDEIGIEFLTLFSQALKNIQDGDNAELKKLLKKNFGPKVAKIQVVVVDEPLPVGVNGAIQESTAVNYPMLNLIKVHRARWNKVPSLHAKESLVLHEILSLLGLEATGDYRFSALYASQYGISKEDFVSLSLANATGSCVDRKGNNIFNLPEVFTSLITQSKNCEQAAQLAQACGWGANVDRATVSAAYEICEAELAQTKGFADASDLLKKMQSKCNQKYENEQGSMYRSLQAYCYLSAIEWVLDVSNSAE